MTLTKRKPYRNRVIIRTASGEACTICGDDSVLTNDTTVFCHLNESWAGKAMSQKADDCAGFFGCAFCHDVYDGRRKRASGPISDGEVLRAYYKTIRRLLDRGILS